MAADDLVMLAARASADMVLTVFTRDNRVSYFQTHIQDKCL